MSLSLARRLIGVRRWTTSIVALSNWTREIWRARWLNSIGPSRSTPTTRRHISVAVWYAGVRLITTARSTISPKRSSSIPLPKPISTAARREKIRATVMVRSPITRKRLNSMTSTRTLFTTAALRWMIKGEHDRAISDFTRSIELSPQQARAFVGRGYARMRKGDPDGALADYTSAIDLNPRSFLAFYNRAFARKQKGDLDGANATFTQALEIDPADVDACYERGIVRGARGDLDGAIADFTKAIELNPQHAKAYANRGIIMLLQGQDAAAQKEFDTALKIENTLNPAPQNRINQIIKGRKSKP